MPGINVKTIVMKSKKFFKNLKHTCKQKWNHFFTPKRSNSIFEISMPLPYIDCYERKQLIEEIKAKQPSTVDIPIEKDDFSIKLINMIEDPNEWNLNLKHLVESEILVFKDANVPIPPNAFKRQLFSSEITIHYNG